MGPNHGDTFQLPQLDISSLSKLVVDNSEKIGIRQRVLSLVYPGRDSFRDNQYSTLPGPNPATLSRNLLKTKLNKEEYWVTEKSDGVRMMFYVNSQAAYLMDRKFEINRVICPEYCRFLANAGDTLLDGELIYYCPADSSKLVLRYMVYDVVSVNGHYIAEMRLSQRLESVSSRIVTPFRECAISILFPFELMGKDFYRNTKDEVDKLFRHINYVNEEYLYEKGKRRNKNDGLIFTPEHQGYIPKDSESLLKWKWLEKNTIDFKIKSPVVSRNRVGKDVTSLYAGGGDARDICIREISMCSEDVNLINTWMQRSRGFSEIIVEFRFDLEKSSWRPVLWREDKNIANYITTVISTMETMMENITAREIVANMK